MSWKPELAVTENGKPVFYQNGQTFATKEEAEKSAYNRFCNWYSAVDHRAVEVDTVEFPVNYEWVDGVGDKMINRPVIDENSTGGNIGRWDV